MPTCMPGLIHKKGSRREADLEVDDDQEDGDGGQQLHDVGQVLAIEGLLQGPRLVRAGDEQMEQGDDCPLKLSPARAADRVGAEGFPDDALADVGGNEERYA